MSRQVALDNINLKECDRWAHTEYSIEQHKEFTERVKRESDKSFKDYLQIDFNWSVNNGLVDWGKNGRVTDMGHAEYLPGGTDMRQPKECPFTTMEEVWAFDAVEEYGLPDFDKQVAAYQNNMIKARENSPNQLTTGGYYVTLVSGAIQAFGWDMLLMAASDPVKMEKVFDSFFRRTHFFIKAWCETDTEAIIQHDDFVWTAGAFMHPDIYRKVIIPRYAELWKTCHKAGKKVLFCSDGNFTEFASDVVEAGADGLIFEPCNDFGDMVDKFGKEVCLIGSYVDCRDLTFEHWDKVKKDIDRTFEKLQECKGAIVAVGNHMPSNIPEHMVVKYFEYLLPKLKK